jgi:hypothetical protein
MMRRLKKMTMTMILLLCLAILLVVTIKESFITRGDVFAKELLYYDSRGKKHCVVSKNQPVVVLVFNTMCRFCRYQLNILESKADSISSFTMYLLSTDSLFFQKEVEQKWQKLRGTPACIFGLLDKPRLLKKIDKIYEPSVLILSSDLRLYTLRRGVQSWQEILKTVNASKRDML